MRGRLAVQAALTGLAVSIAAMAVACSEPSRSPSNNYQLTLFTDSTEGYVAPDSTCGGNILYCRKWFPDSTRDSVRLQISLPTSASDSASATWGKTVFLGTATLHSDGSFTADVNQYYLDAGCESFHFAGTDVHGTVSGTWSQQLDCHNLSRAGHFTGHR